MPAYRLSRDGEVAPGKIRAACEAVLFERNDKPVVNLAPNVATTWRGALHSGDQVRIASCWAHFEASSEYSWLILRKRAQMGRHETQTAKLSRTGIRTNLQDLGNQQAL